LCAPAIPTITTPKALAAAADSQIDLFIAFRKNAQATWFYQHDVNWRNRTKAFARLVFCQDLSLDLRRVRPQNPSAWISRI
jgi:hypothetical protein